MDIRILTLILFLSVAGSFAEFHSPYLRLRRNGMREGRPHIMELVGVPRIRREVGGPNGESENSSKTETATSPTTPATSTTPQSTSNPTNAPTDKGDPTTEPNPTTTSTTPTPSTTSKPNPTTSSTTSNPTSLTDSKPASSTTPAITTTAKSTTKPPSDQPESSPGLGSRSNFEPSENSPTDSAKKAETEAKPGQPSYGYPMPFYPGFPSFSPGFAPNFAPGYPSPYNPYRGDPAFNSIPGPGNYAWTGTRNGPGSASAVASAGASSGSFAGSGPAGPRPMVGTRGGFTDNMPNNQGYGNPGVGPSMYGSNNFAFPGYDPDPFNIQKQIEEHFRQLQAQFDRQQQAIFEASNRIGNEGYPGNSNPGPQVAYSSINLGPGGGYQMGGFSPAAPDLESRFGEDIPPPSGNSYGVFSQSSSSSRTGPDGKQINHKSSTTGVNDNGKISYRTVHD